ncbi:SRPBCC family protein [Tomitella biformata]|uniref:SRPBCC family protein n=1 Tax=Tomitella biformata TaxID=630403 RepID=UPI0004630EC7|nr:SRPBCC family protein [Tomitella biformata]
MATHGQADIEIKATPAEVMDALAAIEDMPKWSGPHRSATVESRHEDGRPNRVRMVISVVGVTDEQVVEYTWNGNESVKWSLVESTQQKTQEGGYVLTPTANGTKADFDLTIDLKIPLPGFIVKKAQKSGIEVATKGLKKWIEGGK